MRVDDARTIGHSYSVTVRVVERRFGASMSVLQHVKRRRSKRRPSGETTLFGDDCIGEFGAYELVLADAFEWLGHTAANSIHAVVTDPPYGLVEYRGDQLEKMKNGNGGVWRRQLSGGVHGRQRW